MLVPSAAAISSAVLYCHRANLALRLINDALQTQIVVWVLCKAYIG